MVDGDTFWFGGLEYQLADANAPEFEGAKCPAESAQGALAAQRLVALMNEGPFEIVPLEGSSTGPRGQRLRVLMREGQSFGARLIEEGFAQPWTDYERFWC